MLAVGNFEVGVVECSKIFSFHSILIEVFFSFDFEQISTLFWPAFPVFIKLELRFNL